NNILGYYLGTALSCGLNYYLGPILVFFVPAAIIFFGWKRLTGESIDYLSFLYAILIVLEVSILLSIHHLPTFANNPNFTVTYNNIGFFFVRLLRSLFGHHTFGPYFLISLSLLVTIFAVFHISPLRMILSLFEFTKKITEKIKERLKKWKEERTQLKKEKTKEATSKENIKAGVKIVKENEEHSEEAKEEQKEISDNKKGISEVEEEAKIQLEKELAAFRARKNEPIKIMTIETQEVEVEEGDGDIPEYILSKENEEESVDFQTTTIKKAVPQKPYVLPDPSVIPDPPPLASMIDKKSIEQNSMILEKTLLNFGIEGKVMSVSPGPVVTRYEIELAPGIKVSRVTSLHDDIAMAVGGLRIRIEAPIPGKSAVGIELPNAERQIVHFKHILMSDAFRKTKAKLPVIIGTNVSGAPYVTDVTKMPHVLIAGQTGSGKSVCINSMVCSLLMTMKPEELRLIMIDPKKVELAYYEGIPHLLSPVVTESKEAVKALQWGVAEMERRYRLMAKVGARNIDSFNSRVESGAVSGILPEEDNKKLPFIVIIVDELADLMITASKDVEVLIQRIAQLA
ncbi:MAG: DNA translocase FtsK, partial [Chitinispirillaceae bacterium]|nr:DNA translocase FtsK [Chitinispirillaceae bacterium]